MAISTEFNLLGQGENPAFFPPVQAPDWRFLHLEGVRIDHYFTSGGANFLQQENRGHDRDAGTNEEGPLVDSPETPVENGGGSFRSANGVFPGKKANRSYGRILALPAASLNVFEHRCHREEHLVDPEQCVVETPVWR